MSMSMHYLYFFIIQIWCALILTGLFLQSIFLIEVSIASQVLIIETFFKYPYSPPSLSHRQATWASWTIENRKWETWASTPETAPSIPECSWQISANGRSRRSPNSWRNGWRRISGTHSDTAGSAKPSGHILPHVRLQEEGEILTLNASLFSCIQNKKLHVNVSSS